jgi:division protein CdvB (Snf7/Vps24/ESCRT-III family)
MEIPLLEKIFFDHFEEKYYLIAVSTNEWNEIKTVYNKNKNNYKYMEEKVDLDELYNKITDEVKAEKKNIIDQLFDNIVEYE